MIDFRSDTVTKPTKEMRLAIHNDISRDNIDKLVKYIKEFIEKKS